MSGVIRAEPGKQSHARTDQYNRLYKEIKIAAEDTNNSERIGARCGGH